MTTTTATKAGPRAWLGLSVLALPMLLASVDNSVLYLALPHLTADLEPSPTQVLWIMDVYGFMMAGFLITMGTLGDRIGRRRLLTVGAAAFGAASVLAAYAVSAEMLIAARILLGVSASALAPSALALVGTMFTDARQRALAIGVFTACFMGGAALGPVVGGVMLENFWWGSVFLLGVPVALLLVLTARPLLPESGGEGGGRLDPASVGLSLLTVIPLVYGLKELADEPDARAALAVAAGLAFGYAFARRQLRLAEPLLDLRLFRNRSFSAALVVLLFTMLVQGGSYFFFSQHLQMIEGFSPLKAGFWMAPPALALVAGSLLAPVVARTVRPAVVVGAGLAVSAAGFVYVAVSDDLVPLVIGFTLGFLGAAPVGALGLNLIVGSAPPEKAGSASATAESSGEMGISLGVAVFGSLGAAVYASGFDLPAGAPERAGESLADADAAAVALPERLRGELLDAAHAAFGSGMTAVAVAAALVCAGLAVLAAVLLRHLRPIGAEDADG
ncbi:MFS transporter [Streptomyces sp. CMB-StM0423]|uniref:MFS transporter n=1 Tax=Streptomyces sp. CMB-StM0423 TaxID=2059884 RepID=UPI000C70FFEE|nr:MFS transporter [Streptomyces sp. CMB-StM0423]AUH38950.1 MFS transporter [Streptomyces sp. CMB-StM0423]